MNYVFTYPLESFDKDASDQAILEAWLKSNGVNRYTLEQFTDLINSENFEHEHYWVRVIEDTDGFFPISCVHRDDLAFIGYDTSKVTDGDMETLANKLGSDYCDQLFWDSLPIIADILGIPKIGEENEDDDDFDFDDEDGDGED